MPRIKNWKKVGDLKWVNRRARSMVEVYNKFKKWVVEVRDPDAMGSMGKNSYRTKKEAVKYAKKKMREINRKRKDYSKGKIVRDPFFQNELRQRADNLVGKELKKFKDMF